MSGRVFRVAELFAGIGLVRLALEQHDFRVVFANDIESSKEALYSENFGHADFLLGDLRDIREGEVPDVDLATASFPCTDLSVAGNRAGLSGRQSGLFWEFARVVREMEARRPKLVLLENVLGFATSHGGKDLRVALKELNELGYWCDLFAVDARHFLPQSRPRLFIVGSQVEFPDTVDWQPSQVRPGWISAFVGRNPDLKTQAFPLHLPPVAVKDLAGIVERLPVNHRRWWPPEKVKAFRESLSPIQSKRIAFLQSGARTGWATAYRRTRRGRATWEIRSDGIAGCLRTARGGSSKQALVEAGRGNVRIRWMTPREYARLQGAPDFKLTSVTENQALFALGDAVCVPVIGWIAESYLRPALQPASKVGEVSVG